MTIDAAASGALMRKDKDEAHELLEEMASNNYQWQLERVTPKKITGVYELDALSTIQVQLALITNQLGAANVSSIQTPIPTCNSCGGGHTNNDGQDGNTFVFAQNEHANYINNSQRSNNPNSNTYPDSKTTQIFLGETTTMS